MCCYDTNAIKFAHSYRASSLNSFIIDVLDSLSIRNAFVTGNFLRSYLNAIV